MQETITRQCSKCNCELAENATFYVPSLTDTCSLCPDCAHNHWAVDLIAKGSGYAYLNGYREIVLTRKPLVTVNHFRIGNHNICGRRSRTDVWFKLPNDPTGLVWHG